MLELQFFDLTDIGCVREENEDAVGSWPYEDGGLLFAVADGLGGEAGGQLASTLALETLAREMDGAPTSWPAQTRLRRAVQQANLDIYTKAMTVPELRGMGTTLTASVLASDTLVTAHVGDCRLYLLRGGSLTQLTKDHTRVWEQVEYGMLSPEAARTHPQRHILSRCLGHNVIPAIDLLRRQVQPGDILFQCSDGIHTSLAEPEIAGILRTHPAETACRAIVARARDAGGHDNLSVQVVSVLACAPAPPRRWWQFAS